MSTDSVTEPTATGSTSARPTGPRSRCGSTATGPAAGDGPRLDRRPHHASTRSSPCSATTSPPSAMDRRGFGASGDTADYSIERDFEDVAAVVDAVAARTGGPVALWGHSYGANCAMGAATLTSNVHHLVLYEPSLGLPYPPGSIEAHRSAPWPQATMTPPSSPCSSTSWR